MTKNNGDLIEIVLPKLGESITEATVLNWLVKEGDTVVQDQVVLEVATDKVDSEVPAPCSGKITAINASPDEIVKIGQVLGRIAVSDVEPAQMASQSIDVNPKPSISAPQKPKLKPQPTPSTNSSTILPGRNDNHFFSPLVREIAIQHHISFEELARIPATGQDGRLRKSDIFTYLEAGRPAQFVQTVPAAAPQNGVPMPDLKFDKGTGKIVEMDRMAQMIADHMVFSKNTSPHVTAYVEADMTAMVNWRQANKKAFQEKYNQKLTFTPLFLQAVGKAIKDFPMINSSLDSKNIIVKEAINIGMAAALPTGNLIVPVVKNVDQKTLAELAHDVNELAVKARENKLKADDTKGGTFTISNVGTFGSLMGTPIINQPEAAILATGIIKKRAEVIEYEEGDKIEIRQMMYLCLSFDHRFVGGHLAGSFLRRVADYFEDFNPQKEI